MLGTQLYYIHTSLVHMFTTPVYMHVLFLYSYRMDHRSYYMYYCSMLSLYSCYMIVSRYRYEYFRYWYWYSLYWIHELLICDVWNPTSIVSRFILFSAINRAHVLLSCYMYHVRDLFRIYCVVKDNKYNLGIGETWRLTRSYWADVWIHC